MYRRPILDIFSRSVDIRDQSLKWSKIDGNFTCFWPQIFLRKRPPIFLEWDSKIQPDSDHVAKFQGDRLRDLGERVAKQKKKHHGQNISPSGTVVPGGLKTSAAKYKPVRNGGSGRPNNFLVCGPTYTNFFRPTWEVVDDQELFRFLIC